jgi:plasmid stability protein
MVAVTVRDIPDGVRDELAARAAHAGKSLQEYLRGLLVAAASKPTVDEVWARARARVTATGARVDARQLLRQETPIGGELPPSVRRLSGGERVTRFGRSGYVGSGATGWG